MSDRAPDHAAPASDSSPGGVTVTGAGRAATVPDVFLATFASQASRARPSEAMDAAAAALTRMRDAAVALGATTDGMTTRTVSLHQDYDQQGPRGFVAELVLVVRTSQVSQAGVLLAGCIEAGGDEARLQGTSFEHADPGALLVAAREAAFGDAVARARQLARLAGRRLGAVLSIDESVPGFVPMARGGAVFAKASAASVPMDPGSQDATVTVTVRWAWA